MITGSDIGQAIGTGLGGVQREYDHGQYAAAERQARVYPGSKLGEVETCHDLQAIMDRLDGFIDAASKSAERVSIVADRVKGATPVANLNGQGLASGGDGSIADIHSRLDRLSNALLHISDGIARIERL